MLEPLLVAKEHFPIDLKLLAEKSFDSMHLSLLTFTLAQASSLTSPTHYGNPNSGCMADETVKRLIQPNEKFCSAQCNCHNRNACTCPQDKPQGVFADAVCTLYEVVNGGNIIELLFTIEYKALTPFRTTTRS